MKSSANVIVRDYSNETLRDLLKEFYKLSQEDAPAKCKLSPKLKALFNAEKETFRTYYDEYSNSKRAIEVEVLWRIINDKF